MKKAIAILSILFLAGCATTKFEETGSATGLGTDPFSTGGAFTAANANAMANAIDDNDDRLDTIEAITGVVYGDGDGTYTSIPSVSALELGYLDGVTSAIQTQLNAKESATSNDIDPDRIAGDTSDDDFLDVAAGGTGGNTAATARTALSVYSIDDITSLLSGKQDDLDVPSDADIVTGTSTDEAVWTIAKVIYAIQQHGQTTIRLRIDTTTTSDPTDEAVGDIFKFDNDTYDPCSISGTTPYFAVCTATGSPGTYKALFDVAGNLLLASIDAETNYIFDSTPDTDDTWQGSRASFVAGETIAQWDIIYLKYNTDGPRAYMYNADSTDSDNDTYRPVGIALAAGTAGNAFNAGIGFGIARNDGWTFTDATDEGKPIFAGLTDGAITLTRPGDSGDHIVHLGNLIDEDEIMFSFGNITDVVVP